MEYIEALTAVISSINEMGIQGRFALRLRTGATYEQIDQMIKDGHLVYLMDGHRLDTPERLAERQALLKARIQQRAAEKRANESS